MFPSSTILGPSPDVLAAACGVQIVSRRVVIYVMKSKEERTSATRRETFRCLVPIRRPDQDYAHADGGADFVVAPEVVNAKLSQEFDLLSGENLPSFSPP